MSNDNLISLRPFQPTLQELDQLHAICADPEVTTYLSWGPNTLHETMQWLQTDALEPENRAIVLGGKEVIGFVRVKTDDDDPDPTLGYLTYALGSDWWGRGFGATAVRQAIKQAFQESYKEIRACAAVANKASIKILERLMTPLTDNSLPATDREGRPVLWFSVTKATRLISLFRVNLSPSAIRRIQRGIEDVLFSGYIGQGPMVEKFERQLAEHEDYSGKVLCTNSCTSALTLALRTIGVSGKPVLTSSITCSATTAAIRDAGGIPVFSTQMPGRMMPAAGDYAVVMEHHELKPEDVGAIVGVAWGGCLPPSIRYSLPESHQKIPTVLDAAQAWAAKSTWRDGDWDYIAYSFGPIKHLTCGDGGALLCGERADYARAKLLRWYGLDRTASEMFRCSQDISELGSKYHMNDLTAAVGLANLPHAAEAVTECRKIAGIYDELIRFDSNLGEGRPLRPRDQYEAISHSWTPWLYTIFTLDPQRFQTFMDGERIKVGRPHRRNDTFPFVKKSPELFWTVDSPGVDWADKYYVCLPVGAWMTEDDARAVADAVNEYHVF